MVNVENARLLHHDDAPECVSQMLAKDGLPLEVITYCAPPRIRNAAYNTQALNLLYLYFLVISLVSYVCNFWNMDSKRQVMIVYLTALPLAFPVLYIFVRSSANEIFGYRVVTNYRAAIVIPPRRWIQGRVTSVQFKTALKKIAEGNFTALPTRCLAKIQYDQTEQSGFAVIYGGATALTTLTFGQVDNLVALDESLSTAIETEYTKIVGSPNPHFTLRTGVEYPTPKARKTALAVALTLVIAFILFGILWFCGLIAFVVLTDFYGVLKFIGLTMSVPFNSVFAGSQKLAAVRAVDNKRYFLLASTNKVPVPLQ